MTITIGELFAGIGGFSLAFHAAGAQTAWFVEKEPYCQRVLAKHFPGVPVYGDIYDCHDLPYVDVVTAGFPCQPFSLAGKRVGENDERYLVPEMFRIIQEVKPRAVVLENVPGFTNIADGDTFNQLLRAVASLGYDAQWGHIRASDLGAPHQRERWFCVAYAQSAGNQRGTAHKKRSVSQFNGHVETHEGRLAERGHGSAIGGGQSVVYPASANGKTRHTYRVGASQSNTRLARSSQLGNAKAHRLQRYWVIREQVAPSRRWQKQSERPGKNGHKRTWAAQRRLGRDPHGLSDWLDRPQWPARPGEAQHAWEPPRTVSAQPDRTARLKALGNAVVPQVVYPIALAIVDYLAQARETEESIA